MCGVDGEGKDGGEGGVEQGSGCFAGGSGELDVDDFLVISSDGETGVEIQSG